MIALLLFALAAADGRWISPRAPVNAPDAPVISAALITTNGVVLSWTVNAVPDATLRFEIKRGNVTKSVLTYQLGEPVIYLAPLTHYAWRDTNAPARPVTYRVRSFSFPAGNSSPWSEAATVNNVTHGPLLRLIGLPPSPPGLPQVMCFKFESSTNLTTWTEIMRLSDAVGGGMFSDFTPYGSARVFYRIQPL